MSADLVIKSNAIFDSVSDEPFSGFVAIKGNKIACADEQCGYVTDKKPEREE